MICDDVDEYNLFGHMPLINGDIHVLNCLNVSECSLQILAQTPTNSHAK